MEKLKIDQLSPEARQLAIDEVREDLNIVHSDIVKEYGNFNDKDAEDFIKGCDFDFSPSGNIIL